MQLPNWLKDLVDKIFSSLKNYTIFCGFSDTKVTLDIKLATILERLDDLSYNLSILEDRVGAVKDSIDGIESDIDDIKEAVTNKNYNGSIIISTDK